MMRKRKRKMTYTRQDKRGAKDVTILMGDFNAKIRADNTGYEDFIGGSWIRADD